MDDADITGYLRERLRLMPRHERDALAAQLGCSTHLLRKIACGDRDNPGVRTIEPLLRYFLAQDKRESTEATS